MKTDQQLRDSIMRRVYAFYFLRQVSAPTVRAVVLVLLALAFKNLVSVTDILTNASHTNGVFGFVYYAFSAFTGTNFLVQFTVVGLALIVAANVIELVSALRNRQGTTYA